MMHLYRRLAVLFTMLLISNSSCFAAPQVVTIAAENSWPPYARADGEGISKQIIQAAFDAVGVKVKFVVAPYARALRLTEMGVVQGCFNVTKQLSTEKLFQFGRHKLFEAPTSFYFNPKHPMHFTSIEEAPDGMSIAGIIGYEYGNAYEQQRHRFKEVRVPTQQQIIGLLRSGEVDAAIMFDKVASYHLQMLGLDENTILKGPHGESSDIYVAFSKHQNFPDMQNIIEQFDRGLELTQAARARLLSN
ncbi:substrate-binding periplasmic protein [Neptunicella sp.]|uniref:substrate-binding periplasmic protein n=1 Tax=Neptunicella sp. TaxID=2125986 RepID=UPI003F68FB9B